MTLTKYIKQQRPGWNVRKLALHTETPEKTLYNWWDSRRKLMECIIAGL